MDKTQMKKSARLDAKSENSKSYPKDDDVSSSSTKCKRNSAKPKQTKVNGSESKINLKKQGMESSQSKKSSRSDAKRNNRKSYSKYNDVSRNIQTPEQLNVSDSESLPSPSSKTPSVSTPRSSFSTRPEGKTPCSFYKVTEDEDGKPVFSKALIKYFLKVDSPEMDDLKNKRWNTSFLRETPQPNRVIKIFTEEEDNDPKYLENVPHIESNLPDVPGSLHKDVFNSMPINDSDEELKKIFKGMTPIKGPNGKKKRKSTRNSCYNGKPLPDDSLMFDYSGLLDISFEDSSSDSKENVDVKVEKD